MNTENKGMGTKLHHALNPLATFPKNNGDSVDIGFDTTESWDCSTERIQKENTRTSFNQLQESMDRLLEQCNKESVRKMMLKHEEIFNEQVQELHRLYRVQKMLMAEMRSKELKLSSLTKEVPGSIHMGADYIESDTQSRFWSSATGSQSSHSPFSGSHHLTPQMEYNFHQRCNIRADPSSHESCSGETFRVQMGLDLERPVEENISSTDVSAIEDQVSFFRRKSKDKMSVDGPHDPHFCNDDDNEIELTLSIGYGTDKKKRDRRSCSDLQLGCSESTSKLTPSVSVRRDQEEECSDPSAASFNRESLQRPHWLFRALSLNRR
ncbi:ras guanine nucleotide exchange factor Q-like protein [Tasmannia lanceolata]|uniref:ras guanine nucleotide exchange factor Q-like protein n=1 Tax=Tasmannia lanceolata TaxID=3420 RepID=UPI004064C519